MLSKIMQKQIDYKLFINPIAINFPTQIANSSLDEKKFVKPQNRMAFTIPSSSLLNTKIPQF